MLRTATSGIVIATLVALFTSTVTAAEPRVDLELAFEGGLSPTAPQKWSRLLSEVGFDRVQLRSTRGNEEVKVDTLGSGRNISYRVSGVILADNQLIVPGGRFSISDRTKLELWLERLRQDGPELLTSAEKPPFNLTGNQLKQVNDDLMQKYDHPTKGQDPRVVIDRIERKLSVPMEIDRSAMTTLRSGSRIEDELEGLSAGTVLAAVVRPLGLALVPDRQGQDVRLIIRRPSGSEDIWPVGWPLQGKRQTVAPQLFELLPVEIDDFPLQETLGAIQDRIDLPMLYDYNALARHDINLEDIRVSYPGKKTSYSIVLQTILTQARLKGELRVDDAGDPFFWITTLRP